jgi:hypothetical protein
MTELNGELARVDAEMETILEKLYQVQQQKTRLTMKINDQKNIRASLDEIQRDMIMLTGKSMNGRGDSNSSMLIRYK